MVAPDHIEYSLASNAPPAQVGIPVLLKQQGEVILLTPPCIWRLVSCYLCRFFAAMNASPHLVNSSAV